MSNYTEALELASLAPIDSKAQILATLAVADALRDEPAGIPDIVFGLVSKKRDDLEATWSTVSLYTKHATALAELQVLRESPDQGYEWSIQPYALHN